MTQILASSAWVTPLIIVVNALVFAAMAATFGTVVGFNPLQLAVWGGSSAGMDLAGQWWRLLTYQFLHANILHIVINMWVMWNVGRLTERLYGSLNLLFIYLAAGTLAGLTSIVWNPEIVSVGASGSIFGVLGAFLAFLARFRNETPSSVLRYWLPALVFAGYNIFAGIYRPAVDNAAHIGGFVAGLALGAIIARDPIRRRTLHVFKVLAAALFAGICALPALWYLDAFKPRTSSLQAFAQKHTWYMAGEAGNLQLWERLAAQLGAGTISNVDAERSFELNILPFWKTASARLDGELKRHPRDGNPYLPKVAEFARLRLLWALSIVATLHDNNPQAAEAAMAAAQKTMLAQAAIDRLKVRDEADNIPVPLNQSAVAIWIKNQIPGLERHCAVAPAKVEKPLSPADDQTDGPAQRHAIGCHAQEMFLAGEYSKLDALLRTYARTTGDLPDGSSRLEGIWAGLDDLFEYGDLSVEEAMRRTSEWRRSVKGSIEPDLVEALIFRVWAYSARGHGYASSVSPQAMQIFVARSAMAAATLRDIAAAGQLDPNWYALSLGVERDQSVPVKAQLALFEKGITKYPAYGPIYRQMLTSLMPRWGGSTEAVEGFIRLVAKSPLAYANLYRMYGDLEGNDYSVIEKSNPDLDKLKQGMGELLNRYPHSNYMLNEMARMACEGHEYRLYRTISPRLNGHVSSAAWPSALTVDSCNHWSS